ncbi:hypothetical protein DASC09_029050 [Saccharomycopsis crataegensis]|uniref:Major facilitator superfamily (MFS) profile domain-containing protein n=1 Tax=Saccharomycopsis crataegensis TaxID=43959 RepID=A0AAV5QM03_9ASCO|nr:hypothetical protein DASC09_029050 [Saccharomycopsis crataegensis]
MVAPNFLTKGQQIVPMKYRPKPLVFGIVVLSLIIDKLNVTGAITSFYSLSKKFDVPIATASWVLSVYALTIGSFIIVFGKVGDIVGPHNTFVIGSFAMSLFSLLAATVDESIYAVIVFRAFQGIAGAALIPSGFAITASYFQGKARFIALKLMAAAITGALGLGVILGGAFDEGSIGYQGLFYFTFAVSFVASVLLYFIIIPVEKTEGHKNLKFKNLDFFGVSLMISGLLLIIVAFTEAANSWNSPKVYVTLPVGFVLLISFFYFELIYLKSYKKKFQNSLPSQQQELTDKPDWRLDTQPLFPAEILEIPNIKLLLYGIFVVNTCAICLQSCLVEYFEYIELDTPIIASVKILPLSVGAVFGSALFNPKIVKALTLRGTLVIAASVGLGAYIWASRIDYTVHNNYWKFAFASQFLTGYSINMFFVVILSGLMQNTPLHLQGVVSGVVQTIAQVGASIGTAVINSIIGSMKYEKGDEAARHRVAKNFQNSLYFMVGLGGSLVILMLFIKDDKSFLVAKNENQPGKESNDVEVDSTEVEEESKEIEKESEDIEEVSNIRS